MKIDFNKTIKDLNGADIVQKDENGKTVQVTLKILAVNSLMAAKENEPGEEKFKKFQLAEKIFKASDPLDIPIEDVTKLKGFMGKDYSPLVVGRAWEILEGK